MLVNSAKRFKPAEVGNTVMVPIPDVDRGRADFKNIKAIVLSVNGDGMYQLGTEFGTLDQMYSRNQFAPTIENFISIADVPENVIISLREAAQKNSIGLGQGFFKCNCKTGCKTKRCKCFNAKKICNSRCHNSNNCQNK